MKRTLYKNIIKAAIIIAAVIFVFWRLPVLTDVVMVVVISFIIAYALKPAQQFLMRRGLGKRMSTLVLLLVLVGVIFGACAVLIPSICSEGKNIAASADEIKKYYEEVMGGFAGIGSNGPLNGVIDLSYERFSEMVGGFAGKMVDKTMAMADSVLIYLVIPPVVYFFLSDGERIFTSVMKYLPVKSKYSLRKTGKHIDKVMGRYVVSQFELCAIIGIMTYLVLVFSGIRYPLLLSVVNAVFNIIPYFGPILGALPILLVTLLTSVRKTLAVTIWLAVIQQLEGNIISPKILGESVDSHPITILLLLIVGEGIGGIFGMVLIVPVWTMAKMFFTEIESYLF